MKRLLLLGDGPAHRQVVAAFGRDRLAAAQALWVVPAGRSFDTALLPGFVAGRHTAQACSLALGPLAEAAGVRLAEAAAQSLDAARRQVMLADGRVAEYELLSIDDDGGVIDRDAIPGAREQGLFVQPAESFARLFGGLLDLAAQRELNLVVLGGGPLAVQLALALQQCLAGDDERARIALVTGGPEPMAGQPDALVQWAARRLATQRITVLREACARIVTGAVHLANGARLACDAPLIATALRPPPWLGGSGLALDEAGLAAHGPTLQSLSHPEVFIAVPEAGELLAHNLRRLAGGGQLRPWRGPVRRLQWLAAGNRHAVLSWGGWAVEGRWVAWWQHRRERRSLVTGPAVDAR